MLERELQGPAAVANFQVGVQQYFEFGQPSPKSVYVSDLPGR